MDIIKTPTVILGAALICSACAEQPQPHPDPVALERLLTSLEAPSAVAAEAASFADSRSGRRRKLERLENSISKLDADRLDPRLAMKLIAR